MSFITNGKAHEHVISDLALQPQELAAGNTTGPWFGFKVGDSAKFIGYAGAMAAAETVEFRLQQASDEEGTGVKAVSVGESARINAVTTITANTRVIEATLTCAAVVRTNTVTIVDAQGNTTTLTGRHATPGTNEFLCEVNDNADAAALAAAINAYVPNVNAVADLAVVTVRSVDETKTALTVSSVGGTITVATTLAACTIEVNEAQLDTGNDFRFVALRADTGAHDIEVSGALERVARRKPAADCMSAIVHEDA